MRWSQTFIPTLKEDPADAEVVSHKLLVRAGFIRQISRGIYDYLPLSLKVIRKIETIVRDEMDRAGAQELAELLLGDVVLDHEGHALRHLPDLVERVLQVLLEAEELRRLSGERELLGAQVAAAALAPGALSPASPSRTVANPPR